MAAAGLGRMKSNDALTVLRKQYADDKLHIGVRRACAWSIRQLTGETLPALAVPPREVWHANWFLEPIGRQP
jgi:hypothetical protein